jgi:uncharacterized protein with FMN-binding domain
MTASPRTRTPVITTTLAEPLVNWLSREVERTKRTRRDIIEEALLSYKRGVYRASLAKMAADSVVMAEAHEMTEWGMDDYAQQLQKIDNE